MKLPKKDDPNQKRNRNLQRKTTRFKCPACLNSSFAEKHQLILHWRLLHENRNRGAVKANEQTPQQRRNSSSSFQQHTKGNTRPNSSPTRNFHTPTGTGNGTATRQKNVFLKATQRKQVKRRSNPEKYNNTNNRDITFRFQFDQNAEELLEKHGLVRNPNSDPSLINYPCHLCHRNFENPIILNRHLHTAHKDSNVFYCSLCDSSNDNSTARERISSDFLYMSQPAQNYFNPMDFASEISSFFLTASNQTQNPNTFPSIEERQNSSSWNSKGKKKKPAETFTMRKEAQEDDDENSL